MTEKRDEQDLSANKIVEQFGDDIKAAIAEIVDQTPSIAKDAAASVVKDQARKSSVHWYLVTIVVAWAGAAGIAWLVMTFAGPDVSQLLVHHANGFVETCAFAVEPSGDRATFVCRLPGSP